MTSKPWVPLPADWPRAPKVSQLRAEFGASGPLVFVVMLCEATSQWYLTTPKERVGGRVRLGWIELGYLAGCEGIGARKIVDRMAELGEIVIDELSDTGFTAKFLAWQKFQPAGPPKDLGAAERKRRQREREREERDGHTSSKQQAEAESRKQ